MTSIQNPLYKTSSNNFVLEFFKDSENEQLSLATAKKYFVQLFGLNILKGYYYFRNNINCEDQIVGVDLIANDNIVANQLTTNKVVSQNIQANKIICDELIVTKTEIKTPSIYGYIYSEGMSLPIIGSEFNLLFFCVPIKKLVQILLLPNTKIIFNPTNSLKPKKLIQNKDTRCKMFAIDLSQYDKFDLYFNDELKQ
jgi:hypothetical protein